MMKKTIEELEEELRVAMLNSDINTLDRLISPQLLFTNHLGHVVSKDEDLESHRNKTFKFQSIELSESEVLVAEGYAVVSVKADIKGFYNTQETSGEFRFSRFWSNSSGSWQVIAGHSCLIS